MKNMTTLQQFLDQKDGVDPLHIYYTFSERHKYIRNALYFLSYALEHNFNVLFLEEDTVYQEIKVQLLKIYSSEKVDTIMYQDNTQFYLNGKQFDADRNSEHVLSLLTPLLEKGEHILIWGQVLFPNENSLSQLRQYEMNCDKFISENHITSVCAYNGLTIPAFVQTELLKTHKYFMTDDEVTISGLYQREHLQSFSEHDRKRIANIERKNRQLTLDNENLCEAYEIIARKKKDYWKLLKELPIPIMISKGETLVYANERALSDLELPPFENIKGESIFNFIHFTDHLLEQKWINTLQSNQEFEMKEVELKLENGSIKTFKLKSIFTWYKESESILHVLIDLTPYKLLEKKMIRAEKLNLAGQLAAGIAHEIKNPLTSIKGFYKLIRYGMGKEKYFNIIDDELDRIEQIANEFLILSKPHSDIFKIHSISRIIEEVKTLLETQAIIKGNDIITSYPEEELLIKCEETKIKQVFVNLLKNAVEATNNGHIYVMVKKQREVVEIVIEDEGCGISKETLSKISEPFFTTKEKGTGLGLLICDKIIDNHNGMRSIESTEGVGTTFTITFPLTKRQQTYIPVDPILYNDLSTHV
ncbi:ATP-binding protein [Alkalihalophilus marmarensis]|uniref:ATP-binding protein n=1 Tax=Alkalihalophilus marmarensis TaxID=521377 RepID=UPI002DC033F2|nr:ATP-binding protein [Alkalihalophilus marmarensis]MEC2072678.1 ATP-binding protein [Alkalihalophilus marmarensis]